MADQLQINIGADTKGLETGLKRATDAVETFDKDVKQVTATSGRAALALGNLGRVASDAPFGFIAISNNIEPLIQSFQAVRKESGSVGGALKALGGSLAGPGGVLLAFSLVSSAITVAVQKYGSLGNAINAIFSTQSELIMQTEKSAKSYEKFNETLRTSQQISNEEEASVAGQIAKIQSLAQIAADQTQSYDNRNAALREFSNISQGYFGQLKIEDGIVKGLTESVNNYTQSIVNSARAKGFESEITKLAPQLFEQEQLLNKLAAARDNVAKTSAKPLPGIGVPIFSETQLVTAAYRDQIKVVETLRARSTELESQLQKLTLAQIQQKVITDGSINSQKAVVKSYTEETSASKKLTEELNRQAEARKKSLAEILERGAKVQTIDFTSIFDLDQSAARERFTKLAQGIGTDFTEALKPSLGTLGRDFTIIPPESIQQAISSLNVVRDNVKLVSDSFTTFLAPAIDSAFNALANGTSVIDAVKNSLRGLLTQLAANAAKALLLKAALSFVPGAGALAGAGGGGGILGALFSGGGMPRLSGAAAPAFGGVSGFGGGLQLAGQVVFTQRGTDLVGVLNSSNARINRVG